MNPDETTLALWLDDELTGSEFTEMEEWASTRPEQLQAREELRTYRQTLTELIPPSQEPPYPDFFNTRVQQGIRDLESQKEPIKSTEKRVSSAAFWKSWLMPLTACAAVILAFNLGRKGASMDVPTVNTSFPKVAPAPAVYTPEEGVNARWYGNNDTEATVIVLAGVTAIPDSTDFSQTVYVPTVREFERMAAREKEVSDTKKQ
ncbi:MAG: hypothetical protein AB8D78_10795 [Akkermansiaceae bacterium]